MQVKNDFFTFSAFFVTIQGLFTAVLVLIVKKQPARILSNILLAFFLITCSIAISEAAIYPSNIYRHFLHPPRINEPFRFLITPLFYFYTLSLTTGRLKWRRAMLLHLIPFVLNLIFLIPFYIQSADEKVRLSMENFASHQGLSIFNSVFWFLLLIQYVLYVYQVKRITKRYQTLIEANFGSVDNINLLWLNTFTNGALFTCFYLALFILLSFLEPLNIPYFHPIPVVVSLLLLFLVYKALSQRQLFSELSEDSINSRQKYEKSSLTPEEARNYLQKLQRYMEIQKPYLDPKLTLQQLANQLQIPVCHLSQVINEKTRYNFYNYVNFYRIEAVKKELSDRYQKDVPILELAFAVGFNSKATFNAVFRKFTGITPQRFRQEFCSKENLHRLH